MASGSCEKRSLTADSSVNVAEGTKEHLDEPEDDEPPRKRQKLLLNMRNQVNATKENDKPCGKITEESNENNGEMVVMESKLSKNEKRKLKQRKYSSNERNKFKKEEKKKKKQAEWDSKWESMTEEEKMAHKAETRKVTELKKMAKEEMNKRILNSKENGIHIGFDLGFYDCYNSLHDLSGIVRQLSYSYNANRNNENPFYFHLLNVDPKYWKTKFDKNGIYNWKGVSIHETNGIEIETNKNENKNENEKKESKEQDRFCVNLDEINNDINKEKGRKIESVVYLSPDSPNVLTEICHSKLYIIGAIVDRSIEKHKSLDRANQFKLQTARLPLDNDNVIQMKQNCLNIDTVVKILLKCQTEKAQNWKQICQSQIPKRMKQVKQQHLKNDNINNKQKNKDNN